MHKRYFPQSALIRVDFCEASFYGTTSKLYFMYTEIIKSSVTFQISRLSTRVQLHQLK